ncbi:MAG: hypothetical protein F2838_08565 [Actinobacteria bacterium]|nr:hypothetical protein [Actinomycetota bacterium]
MARHRLGSRRQGGQGSPGIRGSAGHVLPTRTAPERLIVVGLWVILFLIVYPLAEWCAASWLAGLIGWGGVVLVMACLLVIGSAVVRRAGSSALASLRPVTVEGIVVMPGMTQERMGLVGREVGDAGTKAVAGLLIAVPGLVTSALGMILLIPPVRRVVRTKVGAAVMRRAKSGTTIVHGTVISEDIQRPAGGEIIQGTLIRDDEPEH